MNAMTVQNKEPGSAEVEEALRYADYLARVNSNLSPPQRYCLALAAALRAAHQEPPSLLRSATKWDEGAPPGCYCTDKCMAPVVMGVQTPCRRASSVAAVGTQAEQEWVDKLRALWPNLMALPVVAKAYLCQRLALELGLHLIEPEAAGAQAAEQGEPDDPWCGPQPPLPQAEPLTVTPDTPAQFGFAPDSAFAPQAEEE